MDAASPAPTLTVVARQKLWKLMLEPRLGKGWREAYAWFGSSVALEDILTRRPKELLPEGYDSYNDLLVAAMEATVKDGDAPSDLAQWQWGKYWQVEINHHLFGAIPVLRQWAGTGKHPLSGYGSMTVKAGGRSFGASQRMTVDFSNLDATTLNIVTGQSGQILSPYYRDHWKAWYSGSSFPLAYTPAAVEAAAVHRLSLIPQN